jgi:hypothetical protein
MNAINGMIVLKLKKIHKDCIVSNNLKGEKQKQ